MSLQQSSKKILNQLIQLLNQLNENQYDSPVDTLSDSSIGAHVRHIIEFYDCLIKGYETGSVNYDDRVRNIFLESDRDFALQSIENINLNLNHINSERALKVSMDLSDQGNPVIIDTTFYRELAYNIEHAIHHMAIIRIAIQTTYPAVKVDNNFGVAYSTMKYNDKICAQ